MSGGGTTAARDRDAAVWLRSPAAIRAQCGRLAALAEADRLGAWRLDLSQLPLAADYVLGVIREAYPDLAVPYHSRWRHFDVPGRNHLPRIDGALAGLDAAEAARCRMELAIISVLLDAGAGMGWRFKDPGTGQEYSKSEGLALASIELFLPVRGGRGALSGAGASPWRVTPAALAAAAAPAELARAFQVREDNPLAGFEGRAALLARLAGVISREPVFQHQGQARLGHLYDHLAAAVRDGCLPAPAILHAVLAGLGGIWPARLTLGGLDLGDTWAHPELPPEAPGLGLVPFHKLSQWLTYSLVEPLEWAGVRVTELDRLTGLAEYRNGGLFVDLGVIRPRAAMLPESPLPASDPMVVGWRALTIVLLDRTAALIRAKLGLTAEQLPLAKVLQGGTWTAGRRIAAKRRADGGPPLRIISDGTVF